MPDFTLEAELEKAGFSPVAGTDEAGRGPLAGPVCAAAVILEPGFLPPGLDDSKKLSPKARERVYGELMRAGVCFAVAFATVEEIEAQNIRNASLLAMRRAVEALPVSPGFVLADGDAAGRFACPSRAVVGGDGKSASIAAASVIAKVERDRLMLALAEKHPEYGFEKHKGYGTELHYERLREHGPCEAHRPSFLKKLYGGK